MASILRKFQWIISFKKSIGTKLSKIKARKHDAPKPHLHEQERWQASHNRQNLSLPVRVKPEIICTGLEGTDHPITSGYACDAESDSEIHYTTPEGLDYPTTSGYAGIGRFGEDLLREESISTITSYEQQYPIPAGSSQSWEDNSNVTNSMASRPLHSANPQDIWAPSRLESEMDYQLSSRRSPP
jgi:hypothetical protein